LIIRIGVVTHVLDEFAEDGRDDFLRVALRHDEVVVVQEAYVRSLPVAGSMSAFGIKPLERKDSGGRRRGSLGEPYGGIGAVSRSLLADQVREVVRQGTEIVFPQWPRQATSKERKSRRSNKPGVAEEGPDASTPNDGAGNPSTLILHLGRSQIRRVTKE